MTLLAGFRVSPAPSNHVRIRVGHLIRRSALSKWALTRTPHRDTSAERNMRCCFDLRLGYQADMRTVTDFGPRLRSRDTAYSSPPTQHSAIDDGSGAALLSVTDQLSIPET